MKAIDRLYEYLDAKNLKPTVFEKEIGFSSGYLSVQRKRNADLGESILMKINDYCQDLCITWLLTGEGEMLKEKEQSSNIIPLHKKHVDTVDIQIVDISAAAGYGAINPDYTESLGVIKMPSSMIDEGLHYCIRIKGSSMAPTLQDSDYLVIKHINRYSWSDMPDEHVYMVVDKDGIAYVKRVKNRLSKGFVVLMSDNVDKSNYPNFNLQEDEIHNIFRAEWYFSAKMQNINDTYYNRLKALEDTVGDIKQLLNK